MGHIFAKTAAIGLIGLAATGPVLPAVAQDDEWSTVAQVLGREATQSGEVRRFSFPRSDLHVTLDGVTIKPGFALGSWVAFQGAGDHAMAMGDLVLTQQELAPVMSRLEQGGIAITAVHHHLLRAEPLPMYMHIEGHGQPADLARTIRAALELSGTPLTASSGGGQDQEVALDTAALDQILGRKGKASGGVYQYSIPRAETITEGGMPVPPAMGTAIAINFEPTGGGKAAITGDFVLLAEEVNPVVQALRGDGIEVTALHNHMLDEQPRLFFMHFWANDDAGKLARGLRAALDKIHTAQS